MLFILRLRLPIFEKVVTKPDLCKMCLIFILSVNLFYSVEDFSLEMKTFPYFRKSSSTKLLSFQISIYKCFIFYFWLMGFFKIVSLKKITLVDAGLTFIVILFFICCCFVSHFAFLLDVCSLMKIWLINFA